MEFNFLHNEPLLAAGSEYLPFFPLGWVLQSPVRLLLGIPFAATLLIVLLAHEMGHYYYCMKYGVYATLPFFIPAPTLIGGLHALASVIHPEIFGHTQTPQMRCINFEAEPSKLV